MNIRHGGKTPEEVEWENKIKNFLESGNDGRNGSGRHHDTENGTQETTRYGITRERRHPEEGKYPRTASFDPDYKPRIESYRPQKTSDIERRASESAPMKREETGPISIGVRGYQDPAPLRRPWAWRMILGTDFVIPPQHKSDYFVTPDGRICRNTPGNRDWAYKKARSLIRKILRMKPKRSWKR